MGLRAISRPGEQGITDKRARTIIQRIRASSMPGGQTYQLPGVTATFRKVGRSLLVVVADRHVFLEAVTEIGFPCVVKPVMSSSGKGQSTLRSSDDVSVAWTYAKEGARGAAGKVLLKALLILIMR